MSGNTFFPRIQEVSHHRLRRSCSGLPSSIRRPLRGIRRRPASQSRGGLSVSLTVPSVSFTRTIRLGSGATSSGTHIFSSTTTGCLAVTRTETLPAWPAAIKQVSHTVTLRDCPSGGQSNHPLPKLPAAVKVVPPHGGPSCCMNAEVCGLPHTRQESVTASLYAAQPA